MPGNSDLLAVFRTDIASRRVMFCNPWDGIREN